MAPKFAPKVWKRPYTSIYNDNYRYGNSLYSDAIVDIERKYNEAMATTRLARDRPDLGLSTFADSQLVGASSVARDRTAAASDSLSSERARTISLGRTNSYLEESERKRAQSPSFETYTSVRALDRISSDIEESRLKRTTSVRRRRPESAHITPNTAYESALLSHGHEADGPGQSFWMERCRELQSQLDELRQEYANCESKVKQESSLVKGKINQEVTDLMIALEDQDRHIADMQKQLRRQAKQVSDISLELEASQRSYADVNETLGVSHKRCLNLIHEIEEMRANLEKQHIYKSLASEVQKLNTSASTNSVPQHYDVKRDPRFVLFN